MDGPFDPFSYASLALLADMLWAVTWVKEKLGGLKCKDLWQYYCLVEKKKRWIENV